MDKQNQQKKKCKTDNYIDTLYTLYTKSRHDKLLHILNEVVDFMFKGGTSDYIIINIQGFVLWSPKKRGHHFVFN